MDGVPSDRGRGPYQAPGRPDAHATASVMGHGLPAAQGRAQVSYPGHVVPGPVPGDAAVPVVFTPGLYGPGAPAVSPNGAGYGPPGGGAPANGTAPHGVPPAGPQSPNDVAPPVPPGFEDVALPPPNGAQPTGFPTPPPSGFPAGPGAGYPAAPPLETPVAPPGGFPAAPPGSEQKLDAFFAADPGGSGWAGPAEPRRSAPQPSPAAPGREPPPDRDGQAASWDAPGRHGVAAFEPEPAPVAEAADADAGPRPGRSRHRSSRRRRQLPLWQEVPLLLFAAFLIAVLIRTFLLQAFYIPSGSMEHTLDIGDKVLVNKVVYDVRDPARGEIIVFRGTDRWAPEHTTPPTDLTGQIGRTLGDLVGLSQPGEKDFIKRVIGVPGDIVACCDAQGRVTVNGHPLDEPYIFENAPDDVPASTTECRSREFDPVTIPAGHVYVMGDHRLVSQDSRCQGPVPIDNIIGRAFLVVWPADRWHTLDVPDGFNDVPKPYAAVPAVAPYRPAGTAPVIFVGGIVGPLVWSSARRRRVRARRPRTLTG